jgi:tRNA uridine 5-carboxymethylaminomethyl modification enzyme
MFTSRAEYRLLLRQDNADRRLTPLARDLGLVDHAHAARLARKERAIAETQALLTSTRADNVPLIKILRRPETQWQHMVARLPQLADLSPEVVDQVVYDARYDGYVQRQLQQVDRQKRLTGKRIPPNLDYHQLNHLRTEARQKLARVRPLSVGQASRISGITPADIALLLTYLEGGRTGP